MKVKDKRVRAVLNLAIRLKTYSNQMAMGKIEEVDGLPIDTAHEIYCEMEKQIKNDRR